MGALPLNTLQSLAKLGKIILCWRFKIDWDINISHAKFDDRSGLIIQGTFVGVRAKVDDVGHAQVSDLGQLGLGRLPRQGDLGIEPPPVKNLW
jgi:hypothetical protein